MIFRLSPTQGNTISHNFVGFCFFGIAFHTIKTNQQRANLSMIAPPPKSTMHSPVVTIMKEMKEAKRSKNMIVVGFVVTAKVREMEEKTREGRSRRARKEMVGCPGCGGE